MSVKPKCVMVVEDEVITQRYIKDILTEQSMMISVVVDNSEDALKHLEDTSCDLILMDININGPMDGLRLAKHILGKHDVCIIFITAYSDETTLAEALELAPYGFIIKPFTPNDISTMIKIGYKRFLISRSSPQKNKTKEKEIAITKNLIYDSSKGILFDNGIPVNLSNLQLELMGVLAKNINSVVSNEFIISEVWGDQNANEVSLRTLVYGLRKILPSMTLVTYSKMGYMLKSDNVLY